jgi:hypothetical protein
MTGAAYVVEGGTARATAHAAGPWHPGLQHGGAPAALVVWTAERVPAPAPMRVARLTVELLRPVPVAPLELRVATLREGRKIQLVEVRLLHDGKEVVRGTVLKLRTAAIPLPRGPILPPLAAPPPAGVPADPDFSFGFSAGFELRRLTERGKLGPARVWFRQHAPLVEGEPLSPAMCAAAVADYSNGIATELPWDDWTFINADLTRQPGAGAGGGMDPLRRRKLGRRGRDGAGHLPPGGRAGDVRAGGAVIVAGAAVNDATAAVRHRGSVAAVASNLMRLSANSTLKLRGC